jgi:1,4-dihydroxy-2-naphthoate polyprenyltransferase
MMSKTSAWLLATRPRTLTATLAPIFVGSAVAIKHQGSVPWFLVVCALLCTLFLQITTNLVNDVSDFKKGTDTPDRLGPLRATSQGWLTPKSVWIGAIASIILALAFGFPLLLAGGWPLVILGLASIIAAVAYTAGPYPLAYHGLGEVFVLIFFGWVAVAGLAFALTGSWPIEGALLAGTQVGLLSVTMIAINNLRDINGDRRNGKKTLAARFGENFIRLVIQFSFFGPYILGALWWKTSLPAVFLPFVALPIAIKINLDLRSVKPSKELNSFLGKASLHLLIFGILLSVALIWM